MRAPADPWGTWGCEEPGEPHLILEENGTVGGHDSCNTLGGRWEAEGDRIVFSGLKATLLDCGPGDREWLSGARTARVDGDVMHLQGPEGVEIGALPRVVAGQGA